MTEHRAHVTFKRLHHGRQQLLVPAEEINLNKYESALTNTGRSDVCVQMTHPYISSFFTTCRPYCDLHKPMMSSGGNDKQLIPGSVFYTRSLCFSVIDFTGKKTNSTVTFKFSKHFLSLLVAAELDETLQHSHRVVSERHLEAETTRDFMK